MCRRSLSPRGRAVAGSRIKSGMTGEGAETDGGGVRRATNHSKTVEKVGDVIPVWVHGLDQIDFPLPGPVLDGFFAGDCVRDEVMLLEPDQCFHTVFRGEARCQIVLVLIQAAGQVAGHAGVERAIAPGGKDVDIAFPHSVMIAWRGSARKSFEDRCSGAGICPTGDACLSGAFLSSVFPALSRDPAGERRRAGRLLCACFEGVSHRADARWLGPGSSPG